jgi:hypothetical protein
MMKTGNYPPIVVDRRGGICTVTLPECLRHTQMPALIQCLRADQTFSELILDFSPTRHVDLSSWAGLLLIQRMFGTGCHIRIRGTSARIDEHCVVLGIGRTAHPSHLFMLYLLPVSQPLRLVFLLSMLSASAVAAAQLVGG